LFLEVPYCPISGVGAGIAKDYINKKYYKFFCITKGLMDTFTDRELKVVVDHEQDEIRYVIHRVNEKGGFTTQEEEYKRHLPEIDNLKKVHGNDFVESVMNKARDASLSYPIIPRYILLYWINEFIIGNESSFKEVSIPMTKDMLSSKQINDQKEFLDLIWKEYGDMPSDRFKDIFVTTMRLLHGN